ncbi:MAG: hypothetical protein WC654_04540 [Patescibacteria group bacterium]
MIFTFIFACVPHRIEQTKPNEDYRTSEIWFSFVKGDCRGNVLGTVVIHAGETGGRIWAFNLENELSDEKVTVELEGTWSALYDGQPDLLRLESKTTPTGGLLTIEAHEVKVGTVYMRDCRLDDVLFDPFDDIEIL